MKSRISDTGFQTAFLFGFVAVFVVTEFASLLEKNKRAAWAALKIQTAYSTQVTISSIGLRAFLVISLAR